MNTKLFYFFPALLTTSLYAQEQRPNIIFFLVDDMGWQDTSLPFGNDTTVLNRIYHTPNMERLASMGVKFTQAYACPVSSPSRVSLLTGTNVARHRVSNWTLQKDKYTDAPHKTLSFDGWNCNGITAESGIPHAFYATPLPELLRENGYLTLFVGKAHFAALGTPGENPLNLGFDYNVAGHAAGAMGSYLGEQNYGNKEKGGYTPPWGVPGLEQYHGSDTFLTEALTLEAGKLIDKSLGTGHPFFLYMSHYAVHAPFTADKRFYDRYLKMGLSKTEAQYATLLEGMDKSLGDLIDLVQQKGIADNTVIIFMSDNGGYSVGVRQGDSPVSTNAPLRGGKGACYEGGIREPMIVYWKGAAKSGTVNETPVMIEDFYPTILEMAGVESYHTVQKIDGRSFVATLRKGKGNMNRPLYWHYPNNWGERHGDTGVPQSAIRVGEWKLVHNYEDGSNELYRIPEDISEADNLIDRYPRIAQKLAARLSAHLKETGADLPKLKTTGERLPYPDGTL